MFLGLLIAVIPRPHIARCTEPRYLAMAFEDFGSLKKMFNFFFSFQKMADFLVYGLGECRKVLSVRTCK